MHISIKQNTCEYVGGKGIHMYKHVYIRTRIMQVCIHAHVEGLHTQTRTHARMHGRTHAHTHTYTHLHTRIHARTLMALENAIYIPTLGRAVVISKIKAALYQNIKTNKVGVGR